MSDTIEIKAVTVLCEPPQCVSRMNLQFGGGKQWHIQIFESSAINADISCSLDFASSKSHLPKHRDCGPRMSVLERYPGAEAVLRRKRGHKKL